MITHELAKKLKDAGFPQSGMSNTWACEKEGLHQGRESEDDVYVPTLSELIEACGDKVIVWKWRGRCYATTYNEEKDHVDDHCLDSTWWNSTDGETYETAVANLLLALNTK